MSRRYSPAFLRDWEFYLRIRKEFRFCGKPNEEIRARINPDPNGLDAQECFYFLDGRGEVQPCREPELLFEVLSVKASINWQIRQWAEMLQKGVMWPSELVECRDSHNLPEWVLEATLNQSERMGWPKAWVQYTKRLLFTRD